MATETHGGRKRATANTVTSMRRSAESRQCPECGRKSALAHYSDEFCYGTYCRWDDCGFRNMTLREWE